MVKAADFDSVIVGSIPTTPATNRGRKAQHIIYISFGDTSVYIGE